MLWLSAHDERVARARARLEGVRERIGAWYAPFGFGTEPRVQIQDVLVREGTALLGGSYAQVTILHTADGHDAQVIIYVEEVSGNWYVQWLIGPNVQVSPR